MQVPSWPGAHEAVSLDLYPLHEPQSAPTVRLVKQCREQLESTGACELRRFVTDFGLEQLVAESAKLEGDAYFNAVEGNAYLDEPDASLPADHVRRLTEPTHLGVVAYDQFPKESILRRIYEWDPLMQFVGNVLGLDKIHRYADPMGGLNLSVMRAEDYLRWHFDQTDFVTSLSIRAAEQGGDFEYVPMIRSDKQENYDRVKAVIRGSTDGVVHLPNAPGSLVLFKGRYSLHRVTTIQGGTSRYIGLFGFDSRPGVMSSDHLRKIRYGRTQPVGL